jgi:hypothetical protein
MSESASIPWIEGIEKWRRQLIAELAALPETLRLFREGIDNFQRITKRLLDATESIEQFSRVYEGAMADSRRRIEEAGAALRDQLAAGPGDPVRAAVGDVAKALAAMAELNPLWPRTAGSAGSAGPDPQPAPKPAKSAPKRDKSG